MSQDGGSADVLAVIKEEQASPVNSSNAVPSDKSEAIPLLPETEKLCPCLDRLILKEEQKHMEEIEKLLKEKEDTLTADFQLRIEREIKILKDRFDYILQNEQIRASHMMREAHRERKEKITALQTQLECKNLAGLMYVMCSERRKSKLQLLRLVEDYTKYIKGLQHLLNESQALILNLSRGYKTAARVEQEWKEKMDKVIKEFLEFVYHFSGGSPDTNQYFFDLPVLMKTKTPVEDDPNEDPCETQEEEIQENPIPQEKNWWELIEGDNPPFIVFGDMADFKPPQRREVLKTVKAAKTAPKKWKTYVFNENFYSANCPNLDTIKDEYLTYQPSKGLWECQHMQTDRQSFKESDTNQRRVTTASVDLRGTMGSILKIITSAAPHTVTKATLLGARDSMEIASTTKLREKQRQSVDPSAQKVVLNVGKRIDSIFNQMAEEYDEENYDHNYRHSYKLDEEEVTDESFSALGSLHNDSLDVIPSHVPDQDHRIHYEKICPMEQCQRMKMDSFIRTLPPYMKANPFTHYEQTYDEYEPCTPEQLEILKQRIEERKKKEKVDFDIPEVSPLSEWPQTVDGIGVQTSTTSASLPPCTCGVQEMSATSSIEQVYKVADLIPVKERLDKINRECFYKDNIEFNRFHVVGQESGLKISNDKEFAKDRFQHIQKILKENPSLCELFQANIR